MSSRSKGDFPINSEQEGSGELNIGGALYSDDDVTMTSLLTAKPKYWWGKCPTCPTTDYLPGSEHTTQMYLKDMGALGAICF